MHAISGQTTQRKRHRLCSTKTKASQKRMPAKPRYARSCMSLNRPRSLRRSRCGPVNGTPAEAEAMQCWSMPCVACVAGCPAMHHPCTHVAAHAPRHMQPPEPCMPTSQWLFCKPRMPLLQHVLGPGSGLCHVPLHRPSVLPPCRFRRIACACAGVRLQRQQQHGERVARGRHRVLLRGHDREQAKRFGSSENMHLYLSPHAPQGAQLDRLPSALALLVVCRTDARAPKSSRHLRVCYL